jgi:hypothetical protein
MCPVVSLAFSFSSSENNLTGLYLLYLCAWTKHVPGEIPEESETQS